ncbi:hypothetical protein CUJ84_Chr002482 [Rhizobium leguminosarum]|uniref:DUF2750 domain-containing protein n=3 Tax=Rhizobium/Agrobacterium group TaxID=227290 RepID=A0A2K9Z3L3_RHILE|nr:hypothetical protein CUJ84_Chr002482 [Rhizobium leguminosarum]
MKARHNLNALEDRVRPIADLCLQCFDEEMSTAAAQAERFFSEVIAHGSVWSIQDGEGFPTSTNLDGETAMPFWSLESRAQKVIDNVIAYNSFRTRRIELSEFLDRWLSGLKRDGLAVGINWSGKRAIGYDMTPENVRTRIEISR